MPFAWSGVKVFMLRLYECSIRPADYALRCREQFRARAAIDNCVAHCR